MYNKNGDIVGYIPSKSAPDDQHFTKNTDFLTDGDLKIERLGTVADITTNSLLETLLGLELSRRTSVPHLAVN